MALGETTKREFDSTMKLIGHTVYVRRRRDAEGSGPYQEVEGGRYEDHVEAWTSYRMMRKAPVAVSNGSSMTVQDEGFVSDNTANFYFSAEAAPKTGDLIIELTPHERYERETYMVKRPVPYYISNVLVYFVALCERIDPVV